MGQTVGILGKTDKLVIKIIAQAKRDPQTMFQLEGRTVRGLEAEWEDVRNDEHACKRTTCEEEHAKLLEITERNMTKIIPRTSQEEEEKSSQVEERNDEAYIKWKSRDEQKTEERKTRLEDKRKKERKWDLYRECSNILEGRKKQMAGKRKEGNG